jgi:hypothetical protein
MRQARKGSTNPFKPANHAGRRMPDPKSPKVGLFFADFTYLVAK